MFLVNNFSNSTLSEEVAALLAGGEGERVAFARDRCRVEDLAETFAAFANQDGGVVLLGIGGKTRPKVEGLQNLDSAADLALQAALLLNPPLMLPMPQRLHDGEHDLLHIEIPAGLPNVYSITGKYLHREGPTNAPIPAHLLRELLMERGDIGWDRLVPPDASTNDLDLDKIQRYAERAGSLATDDPWEWLHRRGCVVRRGAEYVPTNAGLLLFARHVERHFPQCEVTLIRYPGLEPSDAWERDDIRDTLPEQIRKAQNWIMEHMRKGSRMAGLEREDWTEYPEGAVREMLVNAVAHRDYAIRGESIRIVMFANRLECYSPGRLPGHVTVHNIESERYSRNEVLVQVLSDLLLIERLGYGIDRIVKQMSSAQLPPPAFQETPAGFMVKLEGRAVGQAELVGVDTRAWLKQGVNERQIAALIYLTEHQRITNRDYRDLQPSVSDETVRRDLADLV
jgi:ATP-dependent DNA helicase RecG